MADEHLISLQPGTVLGGKYEVVKCLGAGSMGLVYACRNRELMGQMVAVKVLFPEVAADKVASARFRNEVLASYEVSHPNVVRAYDLLRDGDLVAYTMEFVGGGDLAERLSTSERIPVSEAVRLMGQIAAGLQAIHDAGIVHRDMKPENILLTKDGNVKIADFGIARNRHGPKLTEHGGVVGTVEYVAPEYMLKSHVDWRSDIYALGILAYEMVTGEAPFNGESVYATMTKRLKTDPDPPSKYCSDCPGELDAIILKLMARDPEQRYQSGAAVVEALQQVASTYGYKMGAVAQSASKTVGPSVDPTSVDSSQGRVPVNREPSSDNSPLSGPSSATNAAHRAAATGGRDAPFAAAPRGKQATPPAEGGTEILSSGFVDFDEEREDEGSQELVSVDYQAPAAMAANRGPRIDSEDWERKESYSLVGREAARMRTLSKRYIEQEAEALAVSDIVALGVAAIVGIACGVFFLRLVAPSLLANIIF